MESSLSKIQRGILTVVAKSQSYESFDGESIYWLQKRLKAEYLGVVEAKNWHDYVIDEDDYVVNPYKDCAQTHFKKELQELVDNGYLEGRRYGERQTRYHLTLKGAEEMGNPGLIADLSANESLSAEHVSLGEVESVLCAVMGNSSEKTHKIMHKLRVVSRTI